MSITIEPLGGLGNQLFTYALGKELCARIGTDLIVDLRNFRDYEWHKYELDSFHSNLTVGDFPANQSPAFNFLNRVSGRLGYRPRGVIADDLGTFDPSVLQAPNGTRLRGYFQSWKYFENVAREIRSEMRQISEPSEWFDKTKADLADLAPWIGIHVRRGNYTGIPSMGLARSDYYIPALNLLTRLTGVSTTVVFTDSPEHIHEALSNDVGRKCRVVEAPPHSRPIETLSLMSDADHLIIGNSTFSWWSAWLGERTGRLVVCPRPWLDSPSHNDRDLIPAPWISLVRSTHLSFGKNPEPSSPEWSSALTLSKVFCRSSVCPEEHAR